MTEHNLRRALCAYLADYIAEERARRRAIDASTLENAFDAFEGGAHNMPFDLIIKVVPAAPAAGSAPAADE